MPSASGFSHVIFVNNVLRIEVPETHPIFPSWLASTCLRVLCWSCASTLQNLTDAKNITCQWATSIGMGPKSNEMPKYTRYHSLWPNRDGLVRSLWWYYHWAVLSRRWNWQIGYRQSGALLRYGNCFYLSIVRDNGMETFWFFWRTTTHSSRHYKFFETIVLWTFDVKMVILTGHRVHQH